MERLKQRLEILRNSNVIDEHVYVQLMNFITRLKNKWKIELTEENGAMMVTHIAMALQRIKRGEAVNEIDENVYSEVLKSERIDEIRDIYADAQKNVFTEEIPEEEKKYIYINLLMIKENWNQEDV